MAENATPIATLLILGASGDLTHRLLLPGLGSLLELGQGQGISVVGSGMDDWDDATWQARVKDSFDSADAHGASAAAVIAGARYLKADVSSPADLQRLLDACQGAPAIFFALPPKVAALACEAMTSLTLPDGTRLVLEKPFGTDEASAAALNALLLQLVPEDHIHRVDHFLGKSTVLNLLGLRFANRLLEPLLTAEHVATVEIVFDEALGLEGRAGYYDKAGALIDMIQSHLLQILAVLTMEAPPTLSAEDQRGRKAAVLRATHIWDDDPVKWSRRARYTAGSVDGRELSGYLESEGVDPSRNTETLAEVTLAIDNWRWAGVPILLRSGKAIGAPRKEAVITFKPAPKIPDGFHGAPLDDQLTIGFGPDLASLRINVNGPGDPLEVDPIHLTTDFGPGELEPYGEVLAGVLDGDPSLSVRGDTAEQCWRIVQPVIDAWSNGSVPLQEYPAGSQGPADWE